MATNFRVVIPARLDSTRLPGKVLRDLSGKPMLAHVHQRAIESGADEVVIATDSQQVADAAAGFGAEAVLTRADHESGTTRIEEVSRTRGWAEDAIVVNLQGDEPLMPGEMIRRTAANLAAKPDCDIATLASEIHDESEWMDPNAVKVVLAVDNTALYFSRAPIPHQRDTHTAAATRLRHFGLYAYRVSALQRYCALPACGLETSEALEQLRALHGGMRIHVDVVDNPPPPGVDTEADLARAEAVILQMT